MPDFEKHLISRILYAADIKDVFDRHIHDGMFVDERNKTVFIFIVDYYKKYGEIPPMEILDQEFPDYKIPHIKEPINYCIDKIVENYIRNKGSDILLKNTKLLVEKPLVGLDLLKSDFNRLTIETNPTDDSNIINSVEKRMKFYLKVKEMKGMDGYSTPWEPLNKATMGWHKEEFIVIVSRMGVGKTFCLLLFAEYAWNNGLSVLFVSNEMSTQQIERRFDALHFKLPYEEFRAGLMASSHEERYFSGLKDLENSNKIPMWTVGNIGGVSALSAKIDQYKPDIVCVDGMYLLNDDRRGQNKWERTSNISWDLKQLCTSKKIPIIATTQFNREVEKVKFDQVNLAMLGFSDSIGQDASVVIGLFRNKDMESNREMYIRMLKVREGEPTDFVVSWDLHSMKFDVLSTSDDSQVIDDGELEDKDIDF
jgi:replicative DNA helicase